MEEPKLWLKAVPEELANNVIERLRAFPEQSTKPPPIMMQKEGQNWCLAGVYTAQSEQELLFLRITSDGKCQVNGDHNKHWWRIVPITIKKFMVEDKKDQDKDLTIPWTEEKASPQSLSPESPDFAQSTPSPSQSEPARSGRSIFDIESDPHSLNIL